ncbi:MAG: C40 family peptidase [Fulvivirga sp.]|uniref:C40 family peptidase n=1 Tax=Fulvivirga sp. TaxID=1931237 RepID=UPI0032ED04EB
MEIGDKGIARLSIIPVRSEPKDAAEMVTQLLFGDHYTITDISDNKKWCRIKMFFDGYEGWIDAKQHHAISNEYFDQINHSDYKICTDLSATILFNKHQTNIVMGSVLPISTNEIFKVEEQLAFNGEAKSLSSKRDVEFLIQTAKKYLNAPYLWGGRTPFGIDCSGFTQIIFRMCGFKLPRDSKDQAVKGEQVEFENRQAGDVPFFVNKEGKIVHVGVLISENEIIHASGKVRIDSFTQEGIIHAESHQNTHQLHAIRRIIKL